MVLCIGSPLDNEPLSWSQKSSMSSQTTDGSTHRREYDNEQGVGNFCRLGWGVKVSENFSKGITLHRGTPKKRKYQNTARALGQNMPHQSEKRS